MNTKSSDSEPILVTPHVVEGGRILEITINRPAVHNAINGAAARMLLEAWRLFRDDDSLTVAVLRGAGTDGMPTLEVGARMIEQTPGVTRLLDRLEAKGLVRRQRCLKDRRQHLCWITEQGLDLLTMLDAPIVAATEHSLQSLKQQDRLAFIRLLDAIRASLDPSEQSQG